MLQSDEQEVMIQSWDIRRMRLNGHQYPQTMVMRRGSSTHRHHLVPPVLLLTDETLLIRKHSKNIYSRFSICMLLSCVVIVSTRSITQGLGISNQFHALLKHWCWIGFSRETQFTARINRNAPHWKHCVTLSILCYVLSAIFADDFEEFHITGTLYRLQCSNPRCL